MEENHRAYEEDRGTLEGGGGGTQFEENLPTLEENRGELEGARETLKGDSSKLDENRGTLKVNRATFGENLPALDRGKCEEPLAPLEESRRKLEKNR